jgi:hypothetical protein
MSKDINDIMKEVIKSGKEIHRVDTKFSKEIIGLQKDVEGLHKDIKVIASKIDLILDLLNSLTIFIEEEDESLDDDDDEYQSNEGWLPEVNNWEEKYLEDEDEEELDG